MTRGDPLEFAGQRDWQVRANDDAGANAIGGKGRERVGHERRGLPDRNDAQHAAIQTRTHVGVLNGASDEMLRRCGVDRAARNG
jgi:hypothetical protein